MIKKNCLSIGILARDSELKEIKKKLLPSFAWSDEILILVDGSPDKVDGFPKNTRVLFNKLKDFSSQRNYLLRKLRNDWVFFIDCDEQVSPSFIKELFFQLKKNKYSGFKIKRNEVFLGKKLRYGEASSWLLRIGDKKRGLWEGKVHEKWLIKGKVGKIKTPINHFAYKKGVFGFLEKNIHYAKMRSEALCSQRKASLFWLFIKPILKFCQNFFWRRGFLDGLPGLIHAFCMAYFSLAVELFLFDCFSKNKSLK